MRNCSLCQFLVFLTLAICPPIMAEVLTADVVTFSASYAQHAVQVYCRNNTEAKLDIVLSSLQVCEAGGRALAPAAGKQGEKIVYQVPAKATLAIPVDLTALGYSVEAGQPYFLHLSWHVEADAESRIDIVQQLPFILPASTLQVNSEWVTVRDVQARLCIALDHVAGSTMTVELKNLSAQSVEFLENPGLIMTVAKSGEAVLPVLVREIFRQPVPFSLPTGATMHLPMSHAPIPAGASAYPLQGYAETYELAPGDYDLNLRLYASVKSIGQQLVWTFPVITVTLPPLKP